MNQIVTVFLGNEAIKGTLEEVLKILQAVNVTEIVGYVWKGGEFIKLFIQL